MGTQMNPDPSRTRLPAGTLVTGTVAGLASAAMLALLARAAGKGTLQPINATSHWLHGRKAASRGQLDAAHTLVGFATHCASAVFWALPFQFWQTRRRSRSLGALLGGACITSAVAAAVDYGVTPKRFTPGWELVLGKRSLVVTYAALALGLAAGARLAHGLTGDR